MGSKSRETIYGASVRAAAERATEARKDADRLACEAWNKRMLGFQGPAQPSPTLGDAINAGFRLSRSEMPWLQHASDRRARHRAATEDNALFRVVNRYVGNLAPMPGVFPDYPAPVIRKHGTGSEMVLMR